MERASNRLAVLHELTSGLAERMGLQAIASFVLGVGLDAIEANRGTLCMLTTDGKSLEVVAYAGYDPDVMDSWRVFPVDAPLPASDAVRTRSAIYLHSPQDRADRYPMFATMGGDGASAMLPLITRDVPLGAIVFGFDGERDFDEGDRAFLAALGTQCAIALDRAHLYEAALRRQADLVLLADASTVLAAAVDDMDEALQQFVNLVAPKHFDICSIYLLDSPRESRLVASAFVEDQRLAATKRVSGFGADLAAEHGLGFALRTGEEVEWDDGEHFITQISRNEEHRDALLAMNLGGGIIVPMLARGRVLGACVFANHDQRIMSDEARRLARTLGERTAVLLDNGRLMRQRKEVSHGLQAALLPPSLPEIPGFEIGARYQSAGEGLEVGGDFYDVVPIGGGKWLLVVGDVTGHGVEAAAATGLVRHTIRSAAMMGLAPSQILDHANAAMLNGAGALPSGVYCTIAIAAFMARAHDDGAAVDSTSKVIVSCGGHPPPMLRRADGHVEQLQAAGRLLGYFPTINADEVTIEMAPGDSLVAFTDGVIERHSKSMWFREDDLMKLIAKSDDDADTLAGLICDTVVNAFVSPPTDDMALLVLRRSPA
ncbi:MAG: SpoIIE family protein phosphatase [Ilumatobacteraceae bacterium]